MYVGFVIKKLSPSWSKFAENLRQKSDTFSLEELFVALRIEDSHCYSNKPSERS